MLTGFQRALIERLALNQRRANWALYAAQGLAQEVPDEFAIEGANTLAGREDEAWAEEEAQLAALLDTL